MEHSHHHHTHAQHITESNTVSNLSLAVSATLHCLVGCGIGEVAGMVLSTWLGLAMLPTMALSISLGFVAGLALGVIPLLRQNFSLSKALKTVLLAEGLSIAVMEAFEVGTQIAIPGVMQAGLADGIFWAGMLASLAAGFIAALPVNYYMIKRGVRHVH
jgi:hypothetical protein